MCGRIACTLAPDEIIQACGYMTPGGQWVYPKWQEAPGGRKYYPSFNLAPSQHSPILYSNTCVRSEDLENSSTKETHCDWIVQPMHWGLVPHWHQGDPKSFSFKMNNARSDGLLQKASFKKPLQMGRRCVVLADGYFEWKTSKDGKKQPFFIHFPLESAGKECKDTVEKTKEPVSDVTDNEKPNTDFKSLDESKIVAADDVKTEVVEPKEISKTDVMIGGTNIGKRLLTMAGLYDVWTGKDGDTLFSYSVITVDAHPDLEFIHDRMPAILNGEEEIRRWLDSQSCPLDKALELIQPSNCLKFYPVSSAVNDARYKSAECIQQIDLKSPAPKKLSASGNFMKSWLKIGTAEPKKSTDAVEPVEKKMKL